MEGELQRSFNFYMFRNQPDACNLGSMFPVCVGEAKATVGKHKERRPHAFLGSFRPMQLGQQASGTYLTLHNHWMVY